MRLGFALLVLLALVAPAAAQSGFYTAPPDEIAAGKPGSLIRVEPFGGAPHDATAYRILYRSLGLKGEPIAVSGVIIVPKGEAPAGGRPVVAWAHPTSGVQPACAPSLSGWLYKSVQGLDAMLARGWVVAATDYPGLGTAGPHPYLVGESEARAVLDSVRAARAMPEAGAGRDVAVWGHSQGGHAALFTGILAGRLAPELRLVGVAAAAPATELGPLLSDDIDTDTGRNLTAMTLWSWTRVYGAPLAKIVDPAAVPVIDALSADCIESVRDIWLRRAPTRELQRHFLTDEQFGKRQPWRGLLARNTPGLTPARLPLYLAQGSKDTLVRPEVTRAYAATLCRAGRRVRFDLLDGVGHIPAAQDSAASAVAWMAARFAGETPPSDCTMLLRN